MIEAPRLIGSTTEKVFYHGHYSLTLSVICCVVSKTMRPGDRKAPVPKRDEKPIHGLVSDKNFIVANAVENILAGK